MKDYYEILGVARDATQDDIKSAFRRLARETHPDANPDDPTAEARFREVATAYEVLSDPQRRAGYDRGEVPGGGDLFSQFAGLDDILQQFFGGGFGGFGFGGPRRRDRRGSDVAVSAQITLDEAADGVTRQVSFVAPVRCDTCSGSGAAPGTSPATCTTCGGNGAVQVSRSTFLGSMVTLTECSTCQGTGTVIPEPCTTCRGSGRIDDQTSVTVDIPAGVEDGQRLRVSGRGAAGPRGAGAGDLYVQIRIPDDKRFERVGDDLHHRLRIGFSEAALGVEVEIPILGGGTTDIDIPSGTQPGTVFRLSRQGMPRLRRRSRGDMLVHVEVAVPESLTKEEEAVLRQFAELRGEAPAEARRKRRFRTG